MGRGPRPAPGNWGWKGPSAAVLISWGPQEQPTPQRASGALSLSSQVPPPSPSLSGPLPLPLPLRRSSWRETALSSVGADRTKVNRLVTGQAVSSLWTDDQRWAGGGPHTRSPLGPHRRQLPGLPPHTHARRPGLCSPQVLCTPGGWRSV